MSNGVTSITSVSIRHLWHERRALLDSVEKYNTAIKALQALCSHKNAVDVSHHGSPDMECPDCGDGVPMNRMIDK